MSSPLIYIGQDLIDEAQDYALLSKSHTSNRHDFHNGTLDDKQQKMFEGKLGEKIFKQWLIDHNIMYQEDNTHYTKPDEYDFIVNGITVDVKTRTQKFHTRTLEMVEQYNKNPKDVYISVRLYPETFNGNILGWITKEKILKINRVENLGYLNNYVVLDNELTDIAKLLGAFKSSP